MATETADAKVETVVKVKIEKPVPGAAETATKSIINMFGMVGGIVAGMVVGAWALKKYVVD